MAKIELVNENMVFDVPNGESLRNAIKGTKALFGCNNSQCGVCCIEVIEGHENLSPIEPLEREQLDHLGVDKNCRLACQIIVNGDCKIRYINEVG